MKKVVNVFLPLMLVGVCLSPVLLESAYGQAGNTNEEEESPMIQVQDRDQVQSQTNIDDAEGVDEQEQNRNEIKKVIINRGEDSQIKVSTENQEREEENYELEAGEQTLFQLELKNEGEYFQIKKNEDGDLYIKNGNSNVKANFPMEIDTETGVVTITKPNGDTVVLKETPSVVSGKVLGEKIMDEIEEFELKEDGDQIKYMLKGDSKRKLLGLFEINVPIEANVNCENADDIEIRKPWYLSLFGFLFTSPE